MNKTKKLFGNKLHKLNELRKTVTSAICLNVYKVMMCPAIDYCSFYTGGAHSGDLIKLQRMQNRALRICQRLAIRDRSILDLHNDCKIDMLDRRRKLQLLGLMWKRAHNGGALEQRRVRTRGDRKIKFAQRRAKTCFYEKSPYYTQYSLLCPYKPPGGWAWFLRGGSTGSCRRSWGAPTAPWEFSTTAPDGAPFHDVTGLWSLGDVPFVGHPLFIGAVLELLASRSLKLCT